MKQVTIKLSYSEIQQAANIATQRNIFALQKKLKAAHNQNQETAWKDETLGCLAEMVVAKHYNVFYNGTVGDVKSGDVGDLEVRATYHERGCLILHNPGKPDKNHILVTANPPFFTLRGWLLAKDGMLDKYWDEKVKGRGCYFVPQSILKPMDELKGIYDETPKNSTPPD